MFVDNHTKWLREDVTSAKTVLTYNNQKIDSFIYDEKIHSELMLPSYAEKGYTNDLSKVIWYNSDYPFYVVRKYYPDYEFYWTFEYDVFFNGKNYRPFFDKYNDRNEDLLSSLYRKDWYSKRDVEWVYADKDLYATLFPVVRLSSTAIDWLYKKRLEYSDIYAQIRYPNTRKYRWLFCETFVPTELVNNGFACANIEEENVRYLPVYNLNTQRIFENPDNKLYHPVK